MIINFDDILLNISCVLDEYRKTYIRQSFLFTDCKPKQYKCDNGKCIRQQYICNGLDDCGDSSDEQMCECGHEQFTCRNHQCIPIMYHCNGWADCSDSSDEDGDRCRGNVGVRCLVHIRLLYSLKS